MDRPLFRSSRFRLASRAIVAALALGFSCESAWPSPVEEPVRKKDPAMGEREVGRRYCPEPDPLERVIKTMLEYDPIPVKSLVYHEEATNLRIEKPLSGSVLRLVRGHSNAYFASPVARSEEVFRAGTLVTDIGHLKVGEDDFVVFKDRARLNDPTGSIYMMKLSDIQGKAAETGLWVKTDAEPQSGNPNLPNTAKVAVVEKKLKREKGWWQPTLTARGIEYKTQPNAPIEIYGSTADMSEKDFTEGKEIRKTYLPINDPGAREPRPSSSNGEYSAVLKAEEIPFRQSSDPSARVKPYCEDAKIAEALKNKPLPSKKVRALFRPLILQAANEAGIPPWYLEASFQLETNFNFLVENAGELGVLRKGGLRSDREILRRAKAQYAEVEETDRLARQGKKTKGRTSIDSSYYGGGKGAIQIGVAKAIEYGVDWSAPVPGNRKELLDLVSLRDPTPEQLARIQAFIDKATKSERSIWNPLTSLRVQAEETAGILTGKYRQGFTLPLTRSRSESTDIYNFALLKMDLPHMTPQERQDPNTIPMEAYRFLIGTWNRGPEATRQMLAYMKEHEASVPPSFAELVARRKETEKNVFGPVHLKHVGLFGGLCGSLKENPQSYLGQLVPEYEYDPSAPEGQRWRSSAKFLAEP